MITKTALLLIDLQNDFMPTGALPVPDGDKVIAVANSLMEKPDFDLIIASQDWHPENHDSFKTLWPVHCVQQSVGAAFHPQLNHHRVTKIIFKGTHQHIDSYSAFFDNEHLSQTELDHFLKQHQIKHLFILGLATDYCVKFTVLDALALGYQVTVIKNGCKGINLQSHDVENAFQEMQNAGANIIEQFA